MKTAIVVGLPWLQTGTGEVMKAQLRFFQSAGMRALFIAVPRRYSWHEQSDKWAQHLVLMQTLPCNKSLICSFRSLSRLKEIILTMKAHIQERKRTFNALDWAMASSWLSQISPELHNDLLQEDVTLLLVNHVYTLPFALKIKRRLSKLGRNVPLVLVTHDVQSRILIDDDETLTPLSRKRTSEDELISAELRELQKADALVHVSADDHTFLANQLPDRPHFLTLPCMEPRNIEGLEIPPDRRRELFFLGSGHLANLRALQWFAGSVVPWFEKNPPILDVAGKVLDVVASRAPHLLKNPALRFAGQVADPTGFFASTTAVAIPMKGGHGISIKTIDALAMGLPIVGTSHAYRGMPLSDIKSCNIEVSDDGKQFANAVTRVLADPKPHASRSQALYERLFTVEKFGASMHCVLNWSIAFSRHR